MRATWRRPSLSWASAWLPSARSRRTNCAISRPGRRFDFPVASDPGDKLGRRLGINFRSDGPPSAVAIELGVEELVHPTVVILDTDHVVRFIDVTPNWMARTEAGPVIEAARKVVEARRETVQA